MRIDRIAARRAVTATATLLLAFGVAGVPRPAPAADIDTVQITAATAGAALTCMRWMPIGTCFWLSCGLTGCTVRTSLKVGHYHPDLVVGAFKQPGETPWVEMRATAASAADLTAGGLILALTGIGHGGGDQSTGTHARDHTTQRFKEGDATGHPAQLLSLGLDLAGLGIDYLCPSSATAFMPYFHSGLDALAWRWAIPETFYPQALIPGLREIGQFPLWTWSAVYPRHGFVNQADDAKAGAVVAQRVGDIVTRSGQPHVYQRLPSGGTSSSLGFRVWRPDPLRERDSRTGYWQMLTPRTDLSCQVFGTNDLASLNSWGVGRTAGDRNYAWALWRPYRCCPRRGLFLFSVQWIPYP